ncbi:MAG: hypothetical protein GMKNLPBB_00959 [Myxococcota bacterium]|nr:hypothetical protein [Myxococcota bacterium]
MIFGRHKKHQFETKKLGTVNVNVIPMIDLLLVINVFLLMNNAVSSQAMYQSPDLQVPKSFSVEPAVYKSEIAVTQNALHVQGKVVEPNMQEYVDTDTPELPRLAEALESLRLDLESKGERPVGEDGNPQFEVTIRSDRNVSFKLLQKVMATCNAHGFTKMHFAVNSLGSVKGEGGGEGAAPPANP